MDIINGDLFAFDGPKVISTNLGWRKDGRNVMGRGVALVASQLYPGLADWYGRQCQKMAENGKPTLAIYEDLILFPVKPLNVQAPWLSWQQKADLVLIQDMAQQLQSLELHQPIGLPLVGCGNGGLDPAEVMAILMDVLDDRFTLVLQ